MNHALDSILPAHVARSNFYRMLDETQDKLRQFIITLRGKQKAVVMSIDEYTSWLETLEIMSDKRLMKSIKKGLKDKKAISGKTADKMIGW